MKFYILAIVLFSVAHESSAAATWSECSKQCGYGVQTLEFCAGFYGKCTTYSRACKIKDCDPGECDKPCGGGRVCEQICTGPGNAPPCSENCKPCNEFPCVPGFNEYSECTKECGSGTRFIVPPCALGDPLQCPKNYEVCNDFPCPPLGSCPVGQTFRYESFSSCCNVQPVLETCGVHVEPSPFQKIFGGQLSTLGLWPWLTVQVRAQTDVAACGGTLIHRRYVLTAAHCMKSGLREFPVSDYYILLGTVKISVPSAGHVRSDIEKFIPHPDYSATTSENDIGLVKLAQDVTFSSTIQPACLPKGEEPPDDYTCYAAGFGISNEQELLDRTPSDDMYHVDLKVLPLDVCIQILGEELFNEIPAVSTIRNLCVGRLSGNKDTCTGDSGGPIMCQRCLHCGWYIAGLTSYGVTDCGTNKPSVYTRINEYMAWIGQNSEVGVGGTYPSCP